ncbi:hypothetical protein GGF31_007072 [Allomyces arbusculus]|nr:hypothetical protein GGF31_007072 [Allomyces arbusculus]
MSSNLPHSGGQAAASAMTVAGIKFPELPPEVLVLIVKQIAQRPKLTIRDPPALPVRSPNADNVLALRRTCKALKTAVDTAVRWAIDVRVAFLEPRTTGSPNNNAAVLALPWRLALVPDFAADDFCRVAPKAMIHPPVAVPIPLSEQAGVADAWQRVRRSRALPKRAALSNAISVPAGAFMPPYRRCRGLPSISLGSRQVSSVTLKLPHLDWISAVAAGHLARELLPVLIRQLTDRLPHLRHICISLPIDAGALAPIIEVLAPILESLSPTISGRQWIVHAMCTAYDGVMAELDARGLFLSSNEVEMPPISAMTVLDAGVAMLALVSPSLASQLCRDHFVPAGWPRPDFAGLLDDMPTRLMRVASPVSPIPVALLAPLPRAPALQQFLVKSCESNDDEVLDLEYHADRVAIWSAIPTLTMRNSSPARITVRVVSVDNVACAVRQISTAMKTFAPHNFQVARTLPVQVRIATNVEQKTGLIVALYDALGQVGKVEAVVTIGEGEE